MKTLKTLLLIIVITIVSSNVFSQTENENNSKFTIGLAFGPNISDWAYFHSGQKAEMKTRGNLFDNIDGITIGITGEYKINNKLSLKTGLLTSNTLEEYEIPYSLYEDETWETRVGIFRSRYHFVNIPINLKFNYFKSQKVSLFINGGLSNKLLVYEKYLIIDKKTNVEVPNIKHSDFAESLDYFLGINFETGIEYKLYENTNLGFYPTFEMSFLNINNSEYGKAYILLGLNLSLTYNL